MTGEDGNAHVIGFHHKIENMSDALRKRLLDNGIPHGELQEFLHPDPAPRKTAEKKPAGKKSRTAAPNKGTPRKAMAAEAKPGSTISAETGLTEYISEKYIPEIPIPAGTEPAGKTNGKATSAEENGRKAPIRATAAITEIPATGTDRTELPKMKNHGKEAD